MNQTYLFEVYLIYSAVAVGLTFWLARTLFRSGTVFLSDVFAGQPAMAEAVNRLLVVGFYLLNLGYAFYMLKASGASTSFEAMEVLAEKLGFLLLSLGIIHFFNLYLFHRIRQRTQLSILPPPIQAQMHMGTARAKG